MPRNLGACRGRLGIFLRVWPILFFSFSILRAQQLPSNPPEAPASASSLSVEVPLIVPEGVPLRLYLTKRAPKKLGAPVEAKVLEPVYAFDRLVIPAGAIVEGRVSELRPVSKGKRATAMLGGDFTPLRVASIEFTSVTLPDGSNVPLHTAASGGLNTIVSSRPAKSKNPAPGQNTGVLGTAKQNAKDAIQGEVDRVKSIPDLVRTPDKKEKAEDYLMAKLPYHPQYFRKGSRFDAELEQPLAFGSERLSPASVVTFGTQPLSGSLAHARLLTPVSSAFSSQGEKVEAVLAEPVYAAGHKLILPDGAHVEGVVVRAKKARSFHRAGQLGFTFREIQEPDQLAKVREQTPQQPTRFVAEAPKQEKPELKIRTEANLSSAESAGKTPIKVDIEGGVKATESKTRFLAAAAALMVARRAGDLDPIRNKSHVVVGQSQNVGGRTLGGGLGFGLLGTAIAQTSRNVGAAFGYYGMAWALYSTLIARGSEVEFGKNAMIEIRFDARPEGIAMPAANKPN